jgi:hypothetical protein
VRGRKAGERKHFFFEKKKQKTFAPALWPLAWTWATERAA